MRRHRNWSVAALLCIAPYALADSSLEEMVISPDRPLNATATAAVESVAAKREQDAYVAHGSGVSVTYQYGRGLPVLVCAPLRVCIIGLEPGEIIIPEGLYIGDSTNWNTAPILAADNRTEIIVKPFDAGLQTNLTIHTDRRTYIIELVSRREEYVPYLAFRYPPLETRSGLSHGYDRTTRGEQDAAWENYYTKLEADRAWTDTVFGEDDDPANAPANETATAVAQGGVTVEDLDFRYRLNGCKRCKFRPQRVFNDGVKTHIVLPQSYNGDLPTFTLIAHGEKEAFQLVNARWFGSRLEIDAVFERGELAVGKQRLIVERDLRNR